METTAIAKNIRNAKNRKPAATPALYQVNLPAEESTDLKTTKLERGNLFSEQMGLRDASCALKQARTAFEAAEKEYKKAIDIHTLHMHEVLSRSLGVVLKRLPLAERRFIVQEIASSARYYMGEDDIIITRKALMKFVEELVFYCM